MQLVVIALGGAAGAVSRFLLSGFVDTMAGRSFPYGTLAVNVVGSFLIGIAFVWFAHKTDGSLTRDLVVVGFLGSLTTFSTFSIQTLGLLQSGDVTRAMVNIVLSVAVCIAASLLGILFARSIWQGIG